MASFLCFSLLNSALSYTTSLGLVPGHISDRDPSRGVAYMALIPNGRTPIVCLHSSYVPKKIAVQLAKLMGVEDGPFEKVAAEPTSP